MELNRGGRNKEENSHREGETKKKRRAEEEEEDEEEEEEESGRHTYVDFTENDVNYAANYDEEVKNIPGITKVALHGADGGRVGGAGGGASGGGGGGGGGLEGEQQQHLLKAQGRGSVGSRYAEEVGELLSSRNKGGGRLALTLTRQRIAPPPCCLS